MSSLLQFNGQISQRGVHLEFYQTKESATEHYRGSAICGDNTDVVFLPGGKVLPRLWTAIRKPAGMFGCWVVFRLNGKERVPDLSCPFALFQRPRDARPLPIAECIKRWQS